MLIAGLLLLQAAAAPAAGAAGAEDTIYVASARSRVAVVVERWNGGPGLSAAALAEALAGRASLAPGGRLTLEAGGVRLDFADGMPWAQAGEELVPLSAAPRLVGGRFLLPPQVVTELLPRLGAGLAWDAASRTLRGAPTTAAATPAAAPVVVEPVAAAPAEPTRLPTIRGERAEEVSARSPASAPAPAPGGEVARRGRYTVVVDAGHGGPDNGMTGPIGGGAGVRVREKDVTLAVSRRLARELERRGYRVVMTRTTDTLIALSDRGRIANREKGDLFLSIHVNAANPRWKNAGGARGFETYFLAEAKTEDARRVEQMENDAVRFEAASTVAANDPLSFIVTDMQQNEHLRESSEVAATVQGALAGIHPGPNRGVKQAGFRVLVTAYMPAVLIEIGFGTNAAEAAWMAEAAEQGRMADAIADATDRYFASFERRASR